MQVIKKITKPLLIVCVFVLVACSNSQDSFLKLYNENIHSYNTLPKDKKNSLTGLSLLLPIEKEFENLPGDKKLKLYDEMGEVYLLLAANYAANNFVEKTETYIRLSGELKKHSFDFKFINQLPEFDKMRELPSFKKIMADIRKYTELNEQSNNENLLTVQQQKKDIKVLFQCLEEAHQGIYSYTSKEDFKVSLEQITQEITEAKTPIQFYTDIAKITALVKDGHTVVEFPNTTSDLKDRIPVKVRCINERIFIQKVLLPAYKHLIGNEIESINNIPTEFILQSARTLLSSDGDNVTHKYFKLSSLKILSDLLATIAPKTEHFTIKLKNIDTPVLLNGLSRDEVAEIISAEPNNEAVSFEVQKKSGYGILTVRSFSVRKVDKPGLSFPEYLKSIFTKLHEEKINHLILDLRGNGGGEDYYGRCLYSYFTAAKFTYYKSLTIARNKFSIFNYMEGGQREMPPGFASKNKYGSYSVTKKYNPNVGLLDPSTPHFNGNIYVLIDGGCFSTTSELLSQLKANTKAVFIGEESGGNYYGNNSGIIADIILPESKLKVHIPMLKYVYAVADNYPHKRNGILPDYQINLSVKDFKNGNDPALLTAKELIRKSKKNR